MKVSCAKGFNAVGLLLLTLQVLVYLFEFIVNEAKFVPFFMENWAGALGYLVLVALFAKNRIEADFIMTVIGSLLWVVQFVKVFTAFSPDVMSAFLYCSTGILGVIFILVGLTVDTVRSKKNKN